MSPGHIAPLLNGSSYWTVSPFMRACDALGLPDVVTHVLTTFCPGPSFCRQASISAQPIRAPANASPAESARFSSAFLNTPSGVARSASSSSSASRASCNSLYVVWLTISARRLHIDRINSSVLSGSYSPASNSFRTVSFPIAELIEKAPANRSFASSLFQRSSSHHLADFAPSLARTLFFWRLKNDL